MVFTHIGGAANHPPYFWPSVLFSSNAIGWLPDPQHFARPPAAPNAPFLATGVAGGTFWWLGYFK